MGKKQGSNKISISTAPITRLWVGVFSKEGFASEVILSGKAFVETEDGMIEMPRFSVEWKEHALPSLIRMCEDIVKAKKEDYGEEWSFRILYFADPTAIQSINSLEYEDFCFVAPFRT